MRFQNRPFRSKGFTLIELMITIAIISILVALAVPAYRDYAIRSKVTECINAMAVAKVHVSEYRHLLGAWPPSPTSAAIQLPAGSSQFCIGVSNYSPATGAFALDVDESQVGVLAGIIAPVLTPQEAVSGMINWDCSPGATSISNIKYLPGPCR